MEYYSGLKWNRQLIMNLEGIMLSEKRQLQKVTYCMIPFRTPLKWQNYTSGEQISGCQGKKSGCGYKKPRRGMLVVMEKFSTWLF